METSKGKPEAQKQQAPQVRMMTIEEMKKADEVATIKRFGPYRPPTEETIPKFKAIQEKALEFALLINDLCPMSQQKATAMTLLEQAKMCANASIAIHTPAPAAKPEGVN
jgi:hypothetical protein